MPREPLQEALLTIGRQTRKVIIITHDVDSTLAHGGEPLPVSELRSVPEFIAPRDQVRDAI